MSKADFNKAIEVAFKNASELLPDAKDFTLEEILISENGKNYEVTLSYVLPGIRFGMSDTEVRSQLDINPLMRRMMGEKKSYRTFLVDTKTLLFRGFRMVRD